MTRTTAGFRTEHDSMGEVQVPADALWGAQTQRAVQNFPVSGEPLHPRPDPGAGLDQGRAAAVNTDLGVLPAGHGRRHPRRRRRDRRRRSTSTSSRSTCSRPGRAPRQQHERQRGDRHAGRPSGSAARCTPTTTSTPRSRPTTCSRPRSTSPPAGCWPGGSARAGRAGPGPGGQGRRVRGRREERPYAPDGRDAGHAGPGVRRVRGGHPHGPRPGHRGAARRSASCRWAAPRSAPG